MIYIRSRVLVLPKGVISPVDPTETDPYQMFGFAKTGGVTGGAAGPTVVVFTRDQLFSELEKYRVNANAPKTIIIDRKLSAPRTEAGRGFYCGGNKTIIGIDDAELDFGLWWWPSSPTSGENDNVIVRNLKMGDMYNVVGSDTKDNRDYLTFKGGMDKFWADHITMIASDGTDGSIDIGIGAKYATISYCDMRGEDKACLLTCENLTYAFNYHANGTERQPLISGTASKADVFNNILETTIPSNQDLTDGYGIGARIGASVFAHGNYYKNFIPHPHRTQRVLVSGSTTVYEPHGKMAIEDEYKDNSPASDQFLYNGGTMTWRPPTTEDYHRNYIKPGSETFAWVAPKAGRTLTAANLGLENL